MTVTLKAKTISVEEKEKQIDLPYFCKKDNEFFCVINDVNKVTKVVKVMDCQTPYISTFELTEFRQSEILEATEVVSEGQFLVVYETACKINESLLCTLKIAS